MKISWVTVLNVIVAMVLWTLLDRLVLGSILDSVASNFEQIVQ